MKEERSDERERERRQPKQRGDRDEDRGRERQKERERERETARHPGRDMRDSKWMLATITMGLISVCHKHIIGLTLLLSRLPRSIRHSYCCPPSESADHSDEQSNKTIRYIMTHALLRDERSNKSVRKMMTHLSHT